MIIKSIQKVIKVGDSLAVTLPAKEARKAQIANGQEVEISIKSMPKPNSNENHKNLSEEYEAFKAQYGATLKNLADR